MKLIIDIPEKEYKECMQRCEWDTLTLGVKLIHFVQDGIPLEDIKAEPCFWEKCPYYEADMMFDGEDEYDCGKCKYKDKSVLEDIKNDVLAILDKHI